MDKVEAIIDAIGQLNRVHSPDSLAYKLRNPLLVKSFAKPGKHDIDEEGRRRFPSFINGYKAAYFDVELKIAGNARARLTAESTLTHLLATYGFRELLPVDNVVRFLRRALGDESIGRSTPLSYFRKTIEDENAR